MFDCLKVFFFSVTSVVVLGPLELRVFLRRKMSKFWKSGEVGGPNFGLWLKKKIFFKGWWHSDLIDVIWTVIYCVSMQSIWKLSQCVLRFVLLYRLVFLYTIELKRTEKCIVTAFWLFACNCSHCLDYPIVIRVNSVKNFVFFTIYSVAKIVSSDYYLVLFLSIQNTRI